MTPPDYLTFVVPRNTLEITTEFMQKSAFRMSHQIQFLGDRIVFVETLKTRTIFWVFNPKTAKFEAPLFGAQTVHMSNGEGYIWFNVIKIADRQFQIVYL
jgi:hypothetical protein